jgi:2-polyprenyl-3-methyl-5-hydroxy-6-metoxy-1,4-benzoquinol methylase
VQTDYAAHYARLYREHWWWRAREAMLLDTLRRVLPAAAATRHILDVGCGDAVSFPALAAFGDVCGIEVDEGLLDPLGPYRHRISTRPLGDPMYNADASRFDLITALDVIEHIEEDRTAVAAMAAMLRPGGLLVATVPAFNLLWDHHDVLNSHFRRYTRQQLRAVIASSGLEPVRTQYWFRALFVPKLTVAMLNRTRKRKVEQHQIPHAAINRAMQALCVLEHRALGRVPVPMGTSVLAIARRPLA